MSPVIPLACWILFVALLPREAEEGLLGEQGEEGHLMALAEFGRGADSSPVWEDGVRGVHTGCVA